MSNNRGCRAPRRRPSSSVAADASSKQRNGSDRKTRSLQSLQERFCFTLKRRRSSRPRPPSKGGPGSSRAPSHNHSSKSSIMENGLIQIPHLHCDYYCHESPASLSFSANFAHVSTSSTSTSSASSSITQVGLVHSPISSTDNSSDDGFSSDEVMSLVGCSDFVTENVLDFMPSTVERHAISNKCPDACGKEAEAACGVGCLPEKGDGAAGDASKCSSSVEDDGEPYRIDLSDFEPEVSAGGNGGNEQQGGGAHEQKRYGGEVLCLRLDYEEVLRAWKERGEFFIAKEPSNYPSPYLDPFPTFSHTAFVPHPPFF